MPGYNNQHLIDGMIKTFLTDPFPDKGPETDEYKATLQLVERIAHPVHEHIVSWWNEEGGGIFPDEKVKMFAEDPISGYLSDKIDGDTIKYNEQTLKLYVNTIPAASNNKRGGVIVGLSSNSILYLQGEEIMARVNTSSTLSSVDNEVPSCRAVKLYVDNTIQGLGIGGGVGDMLKSTYDTNNNGIVDNSEKLNGQLGAYYLDWSNHTNKPSTYTPSDHGLLSHTVPTLTPGHFLKALSSTTYGFTTVGLTANDIGAAEYSHTHGNISSSGRIGSTQYLPIITGSSGILEAGTFGTTQYSFCEGSDSRVLNGQIAYGWGDHSSANYHTGIGSSGYLAKYTGNYTQSNSLIYDDGTTAQIGSITTGGNLRSYSTEGSDEAPPLSTGNWSLVTGWQYLTTPNRIEKYADGTSTTTMITGTNSVIGTVYKVVITIDSITGGILGLNLGGTYVDGISTAGTYTFYRTALSTSKLSFTPSATALRVVISSLSIQPLTNGTGNITVDGRLTLRGNMYDSNGKTLFYFANYEGTNHVAINMNPVANYRLAVSGSIYSTGNMAAIGGYITSQQTNTRTTLVSGCYLLGSTAATVTYTTQNSPLLQLAGYAWNTTPTAASKLNTIFILMRPISGATTYPTLAIIAGSVNGVMVNTDMVTINHLGDIDTIGKMNIAAGKTYDINGTPHTHDLIWQTAPSTKTSTGTTGQIARDSNYFYICIATDTWVRTPMSTNW